jgi:hypothetical protein
MCVETNYIFIVVSGSVLSRLFVYFVTGVMVFVTHVYVGMEMSIYPGVSSVEKSKIVNKSENPLL